MIANAPEKPHFDRIMRVEKDIRDGKDDLKALWQSAKEALDKENLAVLKVAVRRALTDRDVLDARRETEDKADDLIKVLGPFVDSPLGEAAVRAAQ